MILTQGDTEMIEQKLLSQGISEKDFLVKKASPDEVPKYLKAADVAISFIKKCYSKQSSSPVKFAEYLVSGLPVISNSGIGDVDALTLNERVGIILNGFSEKDYADALTKVDEILRDENLREHCRTVGYQKFDVEKVAGRKYRRLYQRLLRS
jgi:glycosyltransferase involved in cell wall biosynthesis